MAASVLAAAIEPDHVQLPEPYKVFPGSPFFGRSGFTFRSSYTGYSNPDSGADVQPVEPSAHGRQGLGHRVGAIRRPARGVDRAGNRRHRLQ